MPDNKVVELSGKPRPQPQPPVTDFWFAQVDTRLSRIERMIRRLEWHIWLIFCALGALTMLATLEFLAKTP